jgi:RNA-binding motif X-linked protein 2
VQPGHEPPHAGSAAQGPWRQRRAVAVAVRRKSTSAAPPTARRLPPSPHLQIKNTQKATRREIEQGISDSASWHARFKHSAYVFSGGLDYDLTEGDLLAIFSQYGEIVDVYLARNKDTGKSRGFAFMAYEDQRSTVLAVDNLNGAKVVGRTIRVEHVDNYKKRKAEVRCALPSGQVS